MGTWSDGVPPFLGLRRGICQEGQLSCLRSRLVLSLEPQRQVEVGTGCEDIGGLTPLQSERLHFHLLPRRTSLRTVDAEKPFYK